MYSFSSLQFTLQHIHCQALSVVCQCTMTVAELSTKCRTVDVLSMQVQYPAYLTRFLCTRSHTHTEPSSPADTRRVESGVKRHVLTAPPLTWMNVWILTPD